MDLQGRDLRDPEDLTRLDAFRCKNEYGCADVVEDYVRAAASWVLEEPGRSVKLFFDHDYDPAPLVCVAGYEWTYPANPAYGAFVSFIGVEASVQRSGVGAEVFRTILEQLGDESPGVVVSWRIHAGNVASRRMTAEVTMYQASEYPVPDSEMIEYAITTEPLIP